MALNGYIYGSFSGVSTSWARPVIYWSATQNIGANSSTITASLRYYKYISGVKSFNLDAPTTSINIGGNTTSSAQDVDLRSVAVNGYATIWSRTRTLEHNSNGSLSVDISASGSTGTSLGNITGLSGKAVLNNIPRASVLTRFTLGSQLEYNVANTISADCDIKHTGFYHRLRLEHTDGTLIWQSDTVYSSSNYTITASQVNAILNKIPSSKSATVRLRLYTYSNSARTTQIGNTSTSSNRTWTVNANQKPSMLETPPVNNRASIYSGFMQHQSKANFSFTATAKYGTSIASYKTVLKYPNGTTQTWNARTATSGTLTQTGTHTVTYTATDRRGYSTSSSNNFSVVAYTYPRIASFTAQRNRTTPTTINVYRSVSGIGHSIKKTVQVRYRKTGASSWSTLNTQNFTASSYSGSLSLTNTDLRSSYEFELILTDAYGQRATATRTVGTDSVFIHYDRDKGLGIGKYSEKEGFEVAFPAYFNSDVTLDGRLRKHTGKRANDIVATANHSNSWNNPNNSNLLITNVNNALSVIVGGVENNRQAIIQVGHGSTGYAQHLGTLELNPFGGAVTVNGSEILSRNTVHLNASTNFNNMTEEGIYNIGASATGNTPTGGVVYGTLVVVQRYATNDSAYVNQIFIGSGNRLYSRVRWNGTWTVWSQQWSSSNSNVITASGSNTNGRYIRFSDGTQICWGSATLTYNSTVTIQGVSTYPVSFTSSPFVSLTLAETTSDVLHRSLAPFATSTQSTSVTIAISRPTGSTNFNSNSTRSVSVIAIGRWK